ncbi:hypothetical protein K438DRAFT_2029409 [Mycena galopus ATCC 62051]|nr:hypothetical protein K438DRAFT_2029409 [Mycena galopus ATCC 62051]
MSSSLYGLAMAQFFLFFAHHGLQDKWNVKAPVLLVIVVDTTQIVLALLSTWFRSIGMVSEEFIWSDLYISTFTVQLYFIGQIHRLTKQSLIMDEKKTWLTLGKSVLLLLAVVQMSAGLAETVILYRLEYVQLEKTKKPS